MFKYYGGAYKDTDEGDFEKDNYLQIYRENRETQSSLELSSFVALIFD